MSYQLLTNVSIYGENHTIGARNREGFNVPVTNLKGLVTRSSSDILNMLRFCTNMDRLQGLNGG